jgi:nucleoid-associated protein YgaU
VSIASERATRPGTFFRNLRSRVSPPAPASATSTATPAGFDPDATVPFGRIPPGATGAGFDPDCTVPLGMRTPVAAFDPESTLLLGEAVVRPDAVDRSKLVDVRPASADAEHLVVAGETLSNLAQRFYGSSARWPDIFAANRDRIAHPSKVRVGTVLRIPKG